VFWLGAILPLLNWLSFSLIANFKIPATALTGPWFYLGLALCVWVGAALSSLQPLIRGLAVGLSISSAVAVAQALGWSDIARWNLPAGLLYNSAIQACSIALVIVALCAARDFRYIPALLPGLYLAHSRGGYAMLAVAFIGRWLGWQAALLTTALGAAVTITWVSPSDAERTMLWVVAWRDIGWSGHGLGSFARVLFTAPDGLHYPGHVHNDYLQLAFELGVLAIPVYALYGFALVRTGNRYWPCFLAFATAGLFFFPLYAPIPALTGAVVAGHIIFRRDRVAAGRLIHAAV
jgi:hypothetical protein